MGAESGGRYFGGGGDGAVEESGADAEVVRWRGRGGELAEGDTDGCHEG